MGREVAARLDRTFKKGPVRHILFNPATEATFAEQPPQVAVKSDVELELPR